LNRTARCVVAGVDWWFAVDPFPESLVADLIPPIPSPVELQQQLKKHLDELVVAARADAARIEAELASRSTLGHMWVYSKAFAWGLVETAGETLEALGSAAVALDRMIPSADEIAADILSGRPPLTSNIQAMQEIGAQAKQAATEVATTIDLLARDPVTWAILVDFQERYLAALHSTVLTEAAGGLGLGILVALITGGAGGAAVMAGRGTLILAKVSALLRRLAAFADPTFKRRAQQALTSVLEKFTDRYLQLPSVMALILREGTSPPVSSALWAPRIRPVPFFAVSQWFERKLHPAVLDGIKRTYPAAADLWLKDNFSVPRVNAKMRNHGSCSEPVSISRALNFVQRGGGINDGLGLANEPRFVLAGSVMLAIDARLEGRRRRFKVGGRSRGAGSGAYNRSATSQPRHEGFGEHKLACNSCRPIIRHFRTLELTRM